MLAPTIIQVTNSGSVTSINFTPTDLRLSALYSAVKSIAVKEPCVGINSSNNSKSMFLFKCKVDLNYMPS